MNNFGTKQHLRNDLASAATITSSLYDHEDTAEVSDFCDVDTN